MSKIRIKVIDVEVEHLDELDADTQLSIAKTLRDVIARFGGKTAVTVTDERDDEAPGDLAAPQADQLERAPDAPATPVKRAPAPVIDGEFPEVDEEDEEDETDAAPASARETATADLIVLTISKDPETTIKQLTEDLYGRDTPSLRQRIYAQLSTLVAAKRLRRISKGKYEAVEE